jgi:hypothetical protein
VGPARNSELKDGSCVKSCCWLFSTGAAPNKRLERTRHERASLLRNLGEPLKRNVSLLSDLMKHRLSSTSTFFTKFIFSSVCALVAGLLAFTLLAWFFISHQPVGWFLFLSLVLMSSVFIVCGYQTSRLKKVSMGQGEMYVSNYRQEISVPFSHVIDVTESSTFGFNTIRICFASATYFGREISFIPTGDYRPGKESVFSELRQLIEKSGK